MKQRKYLLVLIVITLISPVGWAQNNNSVSVSNQNPISIDLSALIKAGINHEMTADDTQWINYDLEINPAEPAATISVEISSGNIPPGMELYLQAGNYNNSGHGKTGQPTGKIRLDHTPNVLIYDIGSSNTGRGKHKGHNLTLSMVITDFGLIEPGDYTIYLLYTLKQ